MYETQEPFNDWWSDRNKRLIHLMAKVIYTTFYIRHLRSDSTRFKLLIEELQRLVKYDNDFIF